MVNIKSMPRNPFPFALTPTFHNRLAKQCVNFLVSHKLITKEEDFLRSGPVEDLPLYILACQWTVDRYGNYCPRNHLPMACPFRSCDEFLLR